MPITFLQSLAYMVSGNMDQGASEFQIEAAISKIVASVSFYFNPDSTGIDYCRQNLTSVDVRFWRLMSFPAL